MPFLSNTESLRLSFIQSISESVIFLLMSSDSNQGYLSSGVGLFVSSADNSVHVVIRGISVGCMSFSHANGVGLNVAGVILSWRYRSIGKCFQLFVCTRPLDLASKYAISCLCKNSTVVFEVLWTSMQQRLFSNLISIGLRGNFESNGFTYVTPFLVIVCLGVKDVLFGCNVNDTTPVFPGSTCTLFPTVSGIKIC